MKRLGIDVPGWIRCGSWLVVVVFLAVLQGCATARMQAGEVHPADPWEPMNRSIMSFNDSLDQAILKPAAQLYEDVTPSFVRAGVRNFFANLRDIWSGVNTALQGKGQATVEQGMRVAINSVLGFYGILDWASEMDIPRHKEDFGQTLAVWGVGSGPYVVLPFFGPSTVRDSVAQFTIDGAGDLVRQVDHVPTRNVAWAVRAVDTRQQLLRAEQLLEEAALDRYSFIRDSYLQYRRNQVYDGNPPD
jgi:phospholipid-binding lipoprotein MlaA